MRLLQRLLNPEVLKRDRSVQYKGGFVGRYKLTDDRLKRVVQDNLELNSTFSDVRGK